MDMIMDSLTAVLMGSSATIDGPCLMDGWMDGWMDSISISNSLTAVLIFDLGVNLGQHNLSMLRSSGAELIRYPSPLSTPNMNMGGGYRIPNCPTMPSDAIAHSPCRKSYAVQVSFASTAKQIIYALNDAQSALACGCHYCLRLITRLRHGTVFSS